MIDMLRILAAMRHYRRNGRMTPAELSRLQRRKLERLVVHARRHSPFFARRYAHLSPQGFALEDLPPVTKGEMMANFDDYGTDRRVRRESLRQFVLDPANVGRKYFGHVAVQTSGTGGEPALIVTDARAFAHVKAVGLSRAPGPPMTLSRILRVAARRPGRLAVIVMDGGLYPSYSNFVHLPRLSRIFADVRVFSVRAPMAELVAALNDFQPEGIVGYPSTVTALAHEQLAGRLRILRHAPEGAVVTLSEPLLPSAREVIAQAFEVPVDDFYATGECMYIARSCGHGPALHVATDLALLEIVDRQGRSVPPGVFGHKMYLTNLENRVQPFIRYEVSDVLAWEPGACPCGSPFPRLRSVSGRTDDILYIERADGGMEAIHPYWLMVPLLERHEIRDYQVKQVTRNELEVSVVPVSGQACRPAAIEEALRASLKSSHVESVMRIRVVPVDHLAPDPTTGKARRIWSAVEAPVAP